MPLGTALICLAIGTVASGLVKIFQDRGRHGAGFVVVLIAVAIGVIVICATT